MIKKMLMEIQENFEQRLQAKTGWGRNDVMAEYKAAVLDVALSNLSPVADEDNEDNYEF
jgi:hypothetical protein